MRKGRLKLPAAFKQLLDAAARHPVLHHLGGWQERRDLASARMGKAEALLAESSTMDDAVAKYLNLTSYYGQQVEMDNQTRVFAAADSAWHRQSSTPRSL